MWEAGYLLGEFILQNPSLFTNKTIVELGSGVGLSGLCLRHVNPKKVYLTDYMDQVMQNCQENMEISKLLITQVLTL
jgi:predicted nicotinamide N-methyase